MSKKLIQKLPKSDKNLKKVVTLYKNVSKIFMLEDRIYVPPFSGDEDEVEEELPEEDKLLVARARKIQRFLSQPFSVAETFTGINSSSSFFPL